MDGLFIVDSTHHGNGPIIWKWHPDGLCVASAGSSRVVHIFSLSGEIIEQIVLPSPSRCLDLAWSSTGDWLHIIQEHSRLMIVWDLVLKTTTTIELKEGEITLLRTSNYSQKTAIGLSKGELVLRLDEDKVIQPCSTKRGPIICADWSCQDYFAFAVEKEVSICNNKGETFMHLLVHSTPCMLKFGGPGYEEILAMSLGTKVLSLYNFDTDKVSKELDFNRQCGIIIYFDWFGERSLIIGFSEGYVIVIETESGDFKEQTYCGKIHDHMSSMSYNKKTGLLVTCSNNCIKVINMSDWKEVLVEHYMKDARLDKISLTKDGRVLSVGSSSGCLFNYLIQPRDNLIANDNKRRAFIDLIDKPISAEALMYTCLSALASISVMWMCLGYSITISELLGAIFGYGPSV